MAKQTDERPLKDVRNKWVPYQLPWTDLYGRAMPLGQWLRSRKFTILYLIIIAGIVLLLDYGSTRRCAATWQLQFQCEQAIWMIEFRTSPWSFLASFFTTPFFHNGLDHILFVAIFGMLMPVQSFENQRGTAVTVFVFFFTYVLIGLTFGVFFNFGLEAYPDDPFFLEAFERNWMGGSVGFYGIIGAMAYLSPNKWFLLFLVLCFEAFNRFVLGINIYIPIIHICSIIYGWLECWLWFKVKNSFWSN